MEASEHNGTLPQPDQPTRYAEAAAKWPEIRKTLIGQLPELLRGTQLKMFMPMLLPALNQFLPHSLSSDDVERLDQLLFSIREWIKNPSELRL